MPSSAWKIADHLATLREAALSGSVDARDPAAGLRIEEVGGVGLPGTALFQILIALPAAATDLAAIECFARGADLVATYAETAARPFRAQVYWRIAERATMESSTAAAIELILSVQTSRLDSDPTLSVGTRTAAAEAHRLLDAESAGFVRCRTESQGTTFEPSGGPGCILFRGPRLLSYVEMVHPADFRQATLISLDESTSTLQLTHHMFQRRLEKGVILRSRLRGVFVPRERDMDLAAAEYRRFAASEPPLTA